MGDVLELDGGMKIKASWLDIFQQLTTKNQKPPSVDRGFVVFDVTVT